MLRRWCIKERGGEGEEWVEAAADAIRMGEWENENELRAKRTHEGRSIDVLGAATAELRGETGL